MTLLDLARQIAELRGKQRLFFRIRSHANRKKEAAELLIDCKYLEAALDRTVAGIIDDDLVSRIDEQVDPQKWADCNANTLNFGDDA